MQRKFRHSTNISTNHNTGETVLRMTEIFVEDWNFHHAQRSNYLLQILFAQTFRHPRWKNINLNMGQFLWIGTYLFPNYTSGNILERKKDNA